MRLELGGGGDRINAFRACFNVFSISRSSSIYPAGTKHSRERLPTRSKWALSVAQQSAYLTSPPGKSPKAECWQGMPDLVRDANIPTNQWRSMQINLQYRKLKKRNSNAFAPRKVDVLIHYIIGPSSAANYQKGFNHMTGLRRQVYYRRLPELSGCSIKLCRLSRAVLG